jgi:hypothetical protein
LKRYSKEYGDNAALKVRVNVEEWMGTTISTHREELPMNLRELSDIDLRYESCRIRQPEEEKRLLQDIQERGIQRSAMGVECDDRVVLLNGFKRYRCAKKLNMGTFPVDLIHGDAVQGLIELMRISLEYSLNILEEARMVNELSRVHGISLNDLSLQLGRSRGWVVMRMNVLKGLEGETGKLIFSGQFPAYSYMYVVRPYLKKGAKQSDATDFMRAVAGKGRSIRDVEDLAWGFFEGGKLLRKQILASKLDWTIKKLREVDTSCDACTTFEKQLLGTLEKSSILMSKISKHHKDMRLKRRSFFAQAHILTGRILAGLDLFKNNVEVLHDRCEHA